VSFNTSRKSRSDAEILTHEAGRGFAPSAAMELLLLVTGSLFSGDTFYERGAQRKERLARLAEPVTQADPEFVAALAVFARQGLGLRSGPSALLAHLFWWGPTALAREVAQEVWLRGDEHLETLAYTQAQGWKLRKALKQAVAERLNTMSPAALLKYRRRGRSVSQKDALILCHPQPKDRDHALVYEYLVRGPQALPEARAYAQVLLEERPTWERILSEQGRTPRPGNRRYPICRAFPWCVTSRTFTKQGFCKTPRPVVSFSKSSPAPRRCAAGVCSPTSGCWPFFSSGPYLLPWKSHRLPEPYRR